MSKKSRFKYKKRDKKAVEKRAHQSGGLFDSILKSNFASFNPKEGDYSLRIMPPTWPDAEHYGLDVFVHYGVGSDNQSYACLNKMLGEKCPVCEERKKAEAEGDADYAKMLTATKRVLVWVIDRANEDSGPLLWSMPWTVDRDFSNLSIDKKSGEVFAIDDPAEGFDIDFTRKGKGLKTKYIGAQIARRESPLNDDPEIVDEWLMFIQDNPLTEVIQYFDYDHIAAVAKGRPKDNEDEDDEEDEDEQPVRRRSSKSKAGLKKRAKVRDDDEDDDEDEDELPTKKRATKKRAAVDDEEDDDDEDDDEDDEDDLPPRRKPRYDEEDEDDEDEDDEDEQP